MTSARETVIAGYIPLLDSALLVAAANLGFAEAEGIDLKLVRETSWANIRDRISVGHFDVAHMLGPMPIAASLNITSLAVPMRAPMSLGLGGNAITVSADIWRAMADEGATGGGEPTSTGAALKKVIAVRAAADRPPLRFGVVHPFSGHAYELRYWLAAAGIHPDQDVEITVLPPPLMPDALAVGQIDGYCVGEPWNTVSVATGAGRIVTFKEAIWPASPEKVLGVSERWADKNPELLSRLIRALVKAAEWCGAADNARELADLLASPDVLDCSSSVCLPALTGELCLEQDAQPLSVPFLTFAGQRAHCPQPDHGLWFYSQMVRWGQVAFDAAHLDVVRRTFDAGFYRNALGLDPASASTEPVGFFDAKDFDPQDIEAYVSAFAVKCT